MNESEIIQAIEGRTYIFGTLALLMTLIDAKLNMKPLETTQNFGAVGKLIRKL